MFDPILETKGKFDQHWWGPLLSRDHEHDQAAETVHHSKQETSPTKAKDSTGKSTKDHGNNEKSGCTNPTIAGKFNQRRYSCSQKYIPLADSPDANLEGIGIRPSPITTSSPKRSPRPLWPLGVLQEYQRSCCRSFQSRSTANERMEWCRQCHFSICRGWEIDVNFGWQSAWHHGQWRNQSIDLNQCRKPLKDPADSDSFSTFPQVCIPSLGLCICRVQSSEIAAVYVGSGKPGSPEASMDDLTLDGPLVHESPVQLVQLVQIRYPGFQMFMMFQRQEKPTASLKAVLIDWCTGRVGK